MTNTTYPIDVLRAEFDAVNAEIDALSSEPIRLSDTWRLMTLCERARDIAREYELRAVPLVGEGPGFDDLAGNRNGSG
ncbi:hypothetical protein ACXPWS_22930 [Mycobacterium sp. BMJ-28]